MSERERWTVYPLLLLSIALSVKTFFPKSHVEHDEIVCRRIRVLGASGREEASLSNHGLTAHSVHVTAPDGQDRVVLGTMPPDVGRIQLLGTKGEMLVVLGSDKDHQVGEVTVFGGNELPAAVLTAERGGGALATFADRGSRLVYLTHNGKGAGTLLSFDAEGKPYFYLVTELQQRPTGETPQSQPADEPAAPNESTPPDASDAESKAASAPENESPP